MKSKLTQAQLADKYACYQKSVQDPDHEVEFFVQAFKETCKRTPVVLREDFCGTFAVCCSWVKSKRDRWAIGVDLDPEPIQWGFENNCRDLKQSQLDRIRILQQDVRKRDRHKADIVAAQNFSFWIFKTRNELRQYFRSALSHLSRPGIMVLDMKGGGACYEEGNVDERVVVKGKRGFTYYWTQESFNPITSEASFNISFGFPDKSRLDRLFEYHWRFWTIPEVIEVLKEAGFRDAVVYWEQTDEAGDGTGKWEQRKVAASQPTWLAYVIGIA
ncbi:MAG TPA: hypothetical protein PKD64_05200 [Pirellulaceae bacterium]|nr:hypothetical protein [Pirellulaceae bacterium]HMO91573.1 hypothetical protein [Pirellulaceae bacterium]HMP68270.1 hypothetical protein [Pirellulaceae bacterium]